MDQSRVGLFTSSAIYRLMETPAKSKTYIKEKMREIILKAPISVEADARPLSWGKALEGFVYENHLDINYAICSNDTIVYENGEFAGTPDLDDKEGDCVGEIKCPYTRTGFIDLAEICMKADTEYFKSEASNYYWQIVSNAILLGRKYGELIAYMPHEKEIPDIISYIDLIDDFQLQLDIQWLIHIDIARTPHLPNDCGYNNIYKFKFLVPENDKEELLKKISVAHQHKIL